VVIYKNIKIKSEKWFSFPYIFESIGVTAVTCHCTLQRELHELCVCSHDHCSVQHAHARLCMYRPNPTDSLRDTVIVCMRNSLFMTLSGRGPRVLA